MLGFLVGGGGGGVGDLLGGVGSGVGDLLGGVGSGVGDLLGGGGCGVGDLLGDGVDATRLPTHCHRTEHYDDLAIKQLDLGWGSICYKKRNDILL